MKIQCTFSNHFCGDISKSPVRFYIGQGNARFYYKSIPKSPNFYFFNTMRACYINNKWSPFPMARDFPQAVLQGSRVLFGASMNLWGRGQENTAQRTQPRFSVDYIVYVCCHNTTAALPQRSHSQKSLKYSYWVLTIKVCRGA